MIVVFATEDNQETKDIMAVINNLIKRSQSAFPIPISPLYWVSADFGITESGGAVSQWDDQSGNSYNAVQAVGSKQPSLITGNLNGKPIVRFDGVNDFLASSSVPYGSVNTIIVVGLTTLMGSGAIFTGGPLYNMDVQSGTVQIQGGGIIVGDFHYPSGFNVYTCIRKSGDSSAYLNNVLNDHRTNVLDDIGTGNFYIAGRYGDDYHTQVDIAEIIIYDRELTTLEMDQAYNYLATKYAL